MSVTHSHRLVVLTQILRLWSAAPCRDITCRRASEECSEVVPKLLLASLCHLINDSNIRKS